MKLRYLLWLVPLVVSAQTRAKVRSHITVLDLNGRERIVYSTDRLFEAPNWSPDGTYLLLNSGGRLWKLPAKGGEPVQVDSGTVDRINNDHGISADGKWFAISAGQIYVLPSSGGSPRQVTSATPSYFHGWSPDGKMLAYCAKRGDNFDLYAISVRVGKRSGLPLTPVMMTARITLLMGSGSTSIPTGPVPGTSGVFRRRVPGRMTAALSGSPAVRKKTGFRTLHRTASGSF